MSCEFVYEDFRPIYSLIGDLVKARDDVDVRQRLIDELETTASYWLNLRHLVEEDRWFCAFLGVADDRDLGWARAMVHSIIDRANELPCMDRAVNLVRTLIAERGAANED